MKLPCLLNVRSGEIHLSDTVKMPSEEDTGLRSYQSVCGKLSTSHCAEIQHYRISCGLCNRALKNYLTRGLTGVVYSDRLPDEKELVTNTETLVNILEEDLRRYEEVTNKGAERRSDIESYQRGRRDLAREIIAAIKGKENEEEIKTEAEEIREDGKEEIVTQ